MCYTGTFRYQDSKLDEIRSVFFESLMTILKSMHHYISPNWNARGEWAECPDMELFKTHLEDDLGFEPETANTICYSQTLRQFFDRMIQTPIDESLWDVLFLMSKTKHQSSPWDKFKKGRFFEDKSVGDSKDRVYKIGFYRDTEEKKQDDKKERFCFDKILQLNDMPEPRTRIPWEEEKDENEEIITKTDDDDDSKPTYDILAHERKFIQLLRKIQTWMYASENTIDKRSRYIEAVNHQGTLGCDVLHDGILNKTSQALKRFGKRIEDLKFNRGSYAIIGSYVVFENVVYENVVFECEARNLTVITSLSS